MAAPHKRSLPEKKDIYALSPAATAEQGSEEKTAATAAEKQREKEFLEGWRETEYGKYLISRIKLLGFDWDCTDPSISPAHQRNIERENRRLVDDFADEYGLAELECMVKKAESTRCDNGGGVLHNMLTEEGLFDDEEYRLRQMRYAEEEEEEMAQRT